MKIALYDFCDTVVNFQTADEYVYFAQNYLRLGSFHNTYMNRKVINAFFENRWKAKKKAILYQLRGIEKAVITDAAYKYYKDRILPNIYAPIIEEMRKHRENGYDVYIVSAGYRIYLDFFAEDFSVKGVIANEFEYHNEKFTGKLCRSDCYGEEKVLRLNETFAEQEIEHSISYSDSISDLPLLKWADRGVVVSRNAHRAWVKENGLEDFVLSEHGVEG